MNTKLTNVDILKDLVGIKSFEKTDYTMAKYLIEFAKRQNLDYDTIPSPLDDRRNVLMGLNCKLQNATNAILLCGHVDTVSYVVNKWDTDPLKLTIKDGKAYGLGVADMKNFTANVLANIDKFKEFETPIILALTCDEEYKMRGAKAICKLLKQYNITINYAILGEPTNSLPYNSNKGFYEYVIGITGKACHSSTPENGINSIVAGAKIVTELDNISKTLPNNTTLNIGIFNGGTMCNVVPELTKITFEMRTFDEDVPQMVYNKLDLLHNKLESEMGVKIKMEPSFIIPAFKSSNDNKLNQVYTYLKSDPLTMPASTEAGFYQEYGAKCVVFGVGDLDCCHKENEFIELKEFDEYIEKLLNIIKILE